MIENLLNMLDKVDNFFMNKEEKEKMMSKWAALIGSHESKTTKWDHKGSQQGLSDMGSIKDNDFDKIAFPLVRQVSAQTIGMNLVSVQPIHMEPSEEVKNEVKVINRERKIESITDDKEFEEMKVEHHPDYKGSPKGKLFYMDFKYGVTSSIH